jgi:hypothetical protein
VVLGNPPRPSILDDIIVDIPRPRRTPEVFDDPKFRAIHGRLLRLLGADVEDELAA